MATYAQVRDSIVTQMNTVANIGNVQSYRRVATTYAQLEAAFVATIGGQKQIRGWDVAWESGELNAEGWQGAQMRMTGPETYVVRGYMSANDADASDRTWSGLIEAAMAALVTCISALVPRQSHVTVLLRQNGYMTFDVPGVGTAAIIHHAEIAVRIHNERVI